MPSAANPVLTEYAGWAQWTVWGYGVLALARVVLIWRQQVFALRLHLLFLCFGIAGLYFLYETGDHGAQLVYQYDVGVSAVDQRDGNRHDHGSL